MLNFSARAAGAVVVVSGELDMASAPAFRTALDEAEPRGGRIVLDVAGLTFMDSSGLRELVAFQNSGHVVDIRDASEPVKSVLRMAGLESSLHQGDDTAPGDGRTSALG